MPMTVVVTGKIYNGSTHEWKDKTKEERLMYRGRLNYRDRSNGEWYFIDAVCWKDFGNENGLVGFLEEHFSKDSDNAPTDKGGQAVEFVGYMRPVKRTKTETVKRKFRISGKIQSVDVEVEVEYDTYEFVIESVDFPPTNEKFTSKKSGGEVIDLDDEDEDGVIELVDDEEDEDDDTVEVVEDDEEEVVEKPKPRKPRATGKPKAPAKPTSNRKKKPVDDSEFFDQ